MEETPSLILSNNSQSQFYNSQSILLRNVIINSSLISKTNNHSSPLKTKENHKYSFDILLHPNIHRWNA